MRMFLPLGIVVQALFAFGIVAGYPLLFPTIDGPPSSIWRQAPPVISLITMGLVAVPQMVSAAKTEGTLAYMRSLPIHDCVSPGRHDVWLAVVLPGVVFAVIIGSIRFGLDLQISPLVVPAVILVALTATSIGYALASLCLPWSPTWPARCSSSSSSCSRRSTPGGPAPLLAGRDPQRPADPGDGRSHARHARIEFVPITLGAFASSGRGAPRASRRLVSRSLVADGLRTALARIWSAVLTQRNGVEPSFHWP